MLLAPAILALAQTASDLSAAEGFVDTSSAALDDLPLSEEEFALIASLEEPSIDRVPWWAGPGLTEGTWLPDLGVGAFQSWRLKGRTGTSLAVFQDGLRADGPLDAVDDFALGLLMDPYLVHGVSVQDPVEGPHVEIRPRSDSKGMVPEALLSASSADRSVHAHAGLSAGFEGAGVLAMGSYAGAGARRIGAGSFVEGAASRGSGALRVRIWDGDRPVTLWIDGGYATVRDLPRPDLGAVTEDLTRSRVSLALDVRRPTKLSARASWTGALRARAGDISVDSGSDTLDLQTDWSEQFGGLRVFSDLSLRVGVAVIDVPQRTEGSESRFDLGVGGDLDLGSFGITLRAAVSTGETTIETPGRNLASDLPFALIPSAHIHFRPWSAFVLSARMYETQRLPTSWELHRLQEGVRPDHARSFEASALLTLANVDLGLMGRWTRSEDLLWGDVEGLKLLPTLEDAGARVWMSARVSGFEAWLSGGFTTFDPSPHAGEVELEGAAGLTAPVGDRTKIELFLQGLATPDSAWVHVLLGGRGRVELVSGLHLLAEVRNVLDQEWQAARSRYPGSGVDFSLGLGFQDRL